jgi:hypothetical protein
MVASRGTSDPASSPETSPRPWERVAGYLRDPPDRHLRFLAVGLLALLGVVLVWTRLVNLAESFWHDEAFTVLYYSGAGPREILFGDATFDVNNHVAYNLLSWATAGALGEAEAIYRLWSVLPAIAAVALATWWAWRRIGVIAAIAFAALAVAAPSHLELAPQARGYGLTLLAATLMLVAADRLARDYSVRAFAGFLGAGLLGIWTVFVFAIAFVGQAVALLRFPRIRRPIIAVVGAAGILSALFYAPVLADVFEARAEGEVISLREALLLERTLEWLAIPIRRAELAAWVTLSALAVVVFALVTLWRRGEGGLALILIVPPLFFNVVLSLAGLETAERHQFPLLNHVLILVAVAIGELARLVAAFRPLRPIASAAGVIAVFALSAGTMERSQRLPIEDFREAGAIARESGVRPIVTDSFRTDGLRYYLGEELVELAPAEVQSLVCDADERVVYIRHAPFPPEALRGLWAPANLDCLVGKPAVRVRVHQRGERGDAIDVWIVEPRTTRRMVDDDPAAG